MKLFTAMIGAQGYCVLQACDGLRGLSIWRTGQHPDLIIMDHAAARHVGAGSHAQT